MNFGKIYEPAEYVPDSLISRRIAICENISKLRRLLCRYDRISKNMNTDEFENLQDEMIPIMKRLAFTIEMQKISADSFHKNNHNKC